MKDIFLQICKTLVGQEVPDIPHLEGFEWSWKIVFSKKLFSLQDPYEKILKDTLIFFWKLTTQSLFKWNPPIVFKILQKGIPPNDTIRARKTKKLVKIGIEENAI